MADDRLAVRAYVTGRVQGVCFRAWTRDEAEQRGLTGWVRNEPDGSVTVLLVGPAPGVMEMLDALRLGPPAARVAMVTTEPADPGDRPPGFRILA